MRVHVLVLPLVGLACNNEYQVVAEAGELLLTPGFHDLGAVAVGRTAEAEVELLVPRGEVEVLAVEVNNIDGDAFSVEHGDLSGLNDDSPGTLTLVYAPTEEGHHWASITVITDEGDESEHLLEARGSAAVPWARLYPPVVDFGPVEAGQSGAGQLTVVNQSEVPLELTALTFDNAYFGAAGGEDLPLLIPGDETVTLDLEVLSTGGEESGALSLDFDGLVELDPAWLQVNACSDPIAHLYDADADGFSVCATDCDDSDAGVNPAASESCNGVDDDCDGTVDEDTSCYDDDGDGYTEDDGDCNDSESGMNPGEAEDYDNGMDDDCDGTTDHGAGDFDGDGYADWAGDCDDGDASIYPGAPETADGEDNDCDGTVDEGTDAYDDDGDGYTEDDGDCDDDDKTVHPGSTETADGVDDDCDGTVDEGTSGYDDDGDGYTEYGGDCDDTDASVSPAEMETEGNGVDDDCDGVSS